MCLPRTRPTSLLTSADSSSVRPYRRRFGAPANTDPTPAFCSGFASQALMPATSGAKGPHVAAAQQRLLELGFWNAGGDGVVRLEHAAGGDGLSKVDRTQRQRRDRRGHRNRVELAELSANSWHK